jgi:hypothetical protein
MRMSGWADFIFLTIETNNKSKKQVFTKTRSAAQPEPDCNVLNRNEFIIFLKLDVIDFIENNSYLWF